MTSPSAPVTPSPDWLFTARTPVINASMHACATAGAVLMPTGGAPSDAAWQAPTVTTRTAAAASRITWFFISSLRGYIKCGGPERPVPAALTVLHEVAFLEWPGKPVTVRPQALLLGYD